MKNKYLLGISLMLFFSQFLEAKRNHAYIVADVDTGKILRQKNINKECFPASLTKKMTLYLLFEAIRQGKINFNTRFSVSKIATQQIRSKLGVQRDEKITVKTIIEALIVKSANDIAVVAAEGLAGSVKNFVILMNKKAQQLKMKKTHFCNPSGVSDPKQKTTAKDMAILARAFFKDFPEFVDLFKMRSFNYKGHVYYTHNYLLNGLQGTNGIKTGYIDASGYNISTSIIRYDPEHRPHRFLCIVLGGESRLARDQEVISLLEPILLECQAVFYDANAALLSKAAGIPLINNRKILRIKTKPILIRAPICTKDGMKLLINQYKKRQGEKTLVNLYANLDLFLKEKVKKPKVFIYKPRV